MEKYILPVSFGALDQETYERTYKPLFSLLSSKKNVIPSFLNPKAAEISGMPSFEKVLASLPQDSEIHIFAIVLNYGIEYERIQALAKERNATLNKPLLFSMPEEIIFTLTSLCCDSQKNYVILGHGSKANDNHIYNEIVDKLPSNCHLYLHHGTFTIDAKEITTVPLMLISGRHVKAMNAELIENHQVEAVEKGLLDDSEFVDLLLKKMEVVG